MAKAEKVVLRILLVEDSVEDAEQVISLLRNAGIAVRPNRVDNADQFVKEANRPLVERYAEHPTENATLVLRSDKWNKGKLDAMIEKEPVTVILSQMGWIRAMKGHLDDLSKLDFKQGDSLKRAVKAMTNSGGSSPCAMPAGNWI